MRNGIEIANVQVTEAGQFYSKGTADVTINGKTKTLRALVAQDHVRVYGIAVRNGNGLKVWRGELIRWNESGNVAAYRDGNFRNPQGNGLMVTGFYEDSTNVCEHSSQYVKK
jgi:hypothetical protein